MPLRVFAIQDSHIPSTTPIASGVKPYNSYTRASICRSALSILRWSAAFSCVIPLYAALN